MRIWRSQKQVTLSYSWTEELFLHVSPFILWPHYFFYHRNLTKTEHIWFPWPSKLSPSHNVILRNVETIEPPFDFGAWNDYHIGVLCICVRVCVRTRRPLPPQEIPQRDSRARVIEPLSSWQIDHVHLTASWVISWHVGVNTPLHNHRKKNNFGEEKS